MSDWKWSSMPLLPQFVEVPVGDGLAIVATHLIAKVVPAKLFDGDPRSCDKSVLLDDENRLIAYSTATVEQLADALMAGRVPEE